MNWDRWIGNILWALQKIWSAKAFFFRALLCWCVGLAVFFNERGDNFDSRFRLRGPLLRNDDISLILITEEEWMTLRGRGFQTLRPLKEIDALTDSFFADPDVWEQVLGQLLHYGPAAVGVTFFVGESPQSLPPERQRVFYNSKLFWGARLDSDGQLQRPRIIPIDSSRYGLVDVKTDTDGYMRRMATAPLPAPLLALQLSRAKNKTSTLPSTDNQLINYQGPSGTFPTFSLTELLTGTLPAKAIKDKLIIIGAKGIQSHSVLTPLGPMTKAEAIANLTNTILHKQWITTLPFIFYAFGLLLVLAFSIWIITSYSQFMALLFLGCTWILMFMISIWVFDSLNLWIPIVAPTTQTIVTFVVFLSYQLMVNERENWKLQQDKRYLEEVEEMKNNFLSLVSHDLKTPIAKIQAVADRLLNAHREEALSTDLKTVRNASQDLNRYIQSLLQVSRVESTDFKIRKQPADINELIHRAIEDLQPLAKEKGIQIHQQLEPMFSIELDTTLIYEVILNLIENAVKYAPNGGEVFVSSRELAQDVEVSVRDTGEGIPEDETQKVWNKFYRGRKHDLSTKGTGLGLYLSKYFIQLHGGNVFLNSKLGEGTEVGFRLPLEDIEQAVEA